VKPSFAVVVVLALIVIGREEWIGLCYAGSSSSSTRRTGAIPKDLILR
jgi:hypothetical protein